MNIKEWESLNVLCPMCGTRFKEVQFIRIIPPYPILCRKCAEYLAEKSIISGNLILPWGVKE